MADIYLTNSLTRKKEKFQPINAELVGVYTCGPTVYSYPQIGNYRTYTASDILVRTLKYNGYKVRHVMNLTDVGHLTGDNLGDADLGEDRIEKAAKKEGRTAWDIAKFYSDIFIKEMDELNLLKPDVLPRATDHIQEQIDLVKKLEEKGFTYKTSDGVYFDTKVYEEKTGKKYGVLSTLEKIKEGARVKKNPEKKSPRDFALWKFSYPGGRSFDSAQDDSATRRQMEWESPWGIGFPGWHIECSAMSMRYLGETFDIHVGGEDLQSTHHPNEIVQSEGATDKQFVKYWIHATFLKVDGKRMGKSMGNMYTLADIKKKGFDPLALRYLYLTAHYKDSLNFTWEALESASNALTNLKSQVATLRGLTQRTVLSEEKRKKTENYSQRFTEAINNDLNTSQALAILWEALKSNIPSEDKYDLAVTFDEVLGLRLAQQIPNSKFQIPDEIQKLVDEREKLRGEASGSNLQFREPRGSEKSLKARREKWEEADKIREKIYDLGFRIEDTNSGVKLSRR